MIMFLVMKQNVLHCCFFNYKKNDITWAWPPENLSLGVCKQQRRRPACVSAQSDQHLCYSLIGKYFLDLLQAKFQFLVFVAEETGLSLALLETCKTDFLACGSHEICIKWS